MQKPSGSAELLKDPSYNKHTPISHLLPSPRKMQLLQILLTFTLFTLAYAIPQTPIGSSGSGDTGGTNSGDTGGSSAAASSATSGRQHFLPVITIEPRDAAADIHWVTMILVSSTSSTKSTATSSPASTASPKSAAAAPTLLPDWSVVGGLAVVVGGAVML